MSSPESEVEFSEAAQLRESLKEIEAARADKRRTHGLIKDYINQAQDNLLDLEEEIETLDRQETEIREKLSHLN